MLNDLQFKEAADLIGCKLAAAKAVTEVESNGNGFMKDGRPKILFEGHVFWKQLLSAGLDPKKLQQGNEDVLYPCWNSEVVRPLYKMDQYSRLEKAKKINAPAALCSASWGAFQIMGFNYKACGFASVNDFVASQTSELDQLKAFCNYLKKSHLDVNLINEDWPGFARGYNGPDYLKNQYDTKLKKAFEKFSVSI